MPRGKQWIWFLGALAALFVVIALAAVFDDDTDEPAAPIAPVAAKRTVAIPASLQERVAKLAIISQSCSTDAGYITCEGFVKNISSTAIENVTAVMVYFDETGTQVSSDNALIEYDPLLPDQTSPYKVLTRYNPAFTKASVEFKELFGGEILTRDDSD